MVVGGFPVVVALLTEFLRDGQFVVAAHLGALLHGAAPACSVRALQVAYFGFLGHVSVAFAVAAAEVVLRHVSAPGNGVAVLHSLFHDAHKLVERQVVAFGPAPVVLNFEDELAVERLVRVRGERHVVVHVQAEVFAHVGLRRVGFLAYLHLGGQFAEVVAVDAVEVLFPGE